MFQNLPFSHQIGVYIEYFETIYNLTVISSRKGYTIHYTDKFYNIDKANPEYAHYKFNHNEDKSIIYGFELGIIWLFENYDVPF